jgi:hypothetical protein
MQCDPAVVERTGASRTELAYRMQFAERYPSEQELLNAVEQFRSWRQVVNVALVSDSSDSPVTAVPVVPASAARR